MKVLSAFLVGGFIFPRLTFALALTRGSFGFTCLTFTFIVLPRYLLLTALVLLIPGCVTAFVPHP
jgi:hypothetical protein